MSERPKPDELVIDTTNAQTISFPDAHASPPAGIPGWRDHAVPTEWHAKKNPCPGCRERPGVVRVKMQIEFRGVVQALYESAPYARDITVSNDALYCEPCYWALVRLAGLVEKEEPQPEMVQTGHDTYEGQP